jgi:hypothetical protein
MKAKATALKNKITNKVGGALAAPVVAHYNRKSRQANRDYGAIKDYQAMRDSGSDVVNTPQFRKAKAVYEDIKSKRS